MDKRVLAACLLVARTAAADDAPKLTVAGYVEAFYQYNVNQPSNLVTAYRAFDDRTNSFTIENAVLDVTGTVGPVITHVALQIGHAPSAYYASEPSYAAGAGTGASDADLWRYIQQATVGYKAGSLLVEGGIFLSPIGFENLPIKDQWNWSRSDLFFALPFYHAGVRATFPLTDTLTGAVYVTNGWNDIVNRNKYPCIAGVLTWTPDPAVTASAIYFGGVEAPTGAPEGQPWRHLFDGTITASLTPIFQVAAQVDSGVEPGKLGTSRWVDAAVYARVRPVGPLYLALRGDVFHERDAVGATRLFFPANTVGSITATADYRPASHLSLRLEYRDDRASAHMYFRGTVTNDVPNATSQQTLTLGAVSWF
ncbi:MAG TPA: outer membrane beta-barrel protein [Kofleriaceae bacterium]|jgi:hypothetical protein